MPDRITIEPRIIDRIAHLAHDINEVYCGTISDPATPWDQASDQIKESVRDGVRNILSGKIKRPGDSHKAWFDYKTAEGWKHGFTKDEAKKEHPNLVAFEELPAAQQFKDVLFITTVRGAARLVNLPIPE